MTLLELLKEHLKEWPEGVIAMAQDADGEMAVSFGNQHCRIPRYYYEPFGHIWPYSEGWSIPAEPEDNTSFWFLPLAEDAATAIVTREMWEAA